MLMTYHQPPAPILELMTGIIEIGELGVASFATVTQGRASVEGSVNLLRDGGETSNFLLSFLQTGFVSFALPFNRTVQRLVQDVNFEYFLGCFIT